MNERFRNAAWGLGVTLLHAGKRLGITGWFEHTATALAGKIIKPPLDETEVALPWGCGW